jgi:hypothetical protein
MPKKTAAELRLSRPPPTPAGGYDPSTDIAPDVYAVAWNETRTTVRVAHYAHREAPRACCRVKGQVTDADRAKATAEIPAEVHTLARLKMPCGVDA